MGKWDSLVKSDHWLHKLMTPATALQWSIHPDAISNVFQFICSKHQFQKFWEPLDLQTNPSVIRSEAKFTHTPTHPICFTLVRSILAKIRHSFTFWSWAWFTKYLMRHFLIQNGQFYFFTCNNFNLDMMQMNTILRKKNF